jgi:hypothetical protein
VGLLPALRPRASLAAGIEERPHIRDGDGRRRDTPIEGKGPLPTTSSSLTRIRRPTL